MSQFRLPQMNRRAIRLRTLLSARIIHGVIKIDCEVRDISTCGARLALPAGVPLPHRFDLYIRQRGETHACRLVWFSEGQCGVEFVDPSAAPLPQDAESNLSNRILSLEAEVVSLRKQLEQVRLEIHGRPASLRKAVG